MSEETGGVDERVPELSSFVAFADALGLDLRQSDDQWNSALTIYEKLIAAYPQARAALSAPSHGGGVAHTDCRSEDGITVGLIDSIITSCRVLSSRDLTCEAAVEALRDLRSDSDVSLIKPSHGEQVRCSYAQAVGEALIVAHLGVDDSADSFEQANKKLMSLIDWSIQVATDPAVNGGFKLVPIEPQGRQQFNAAFNLCSEFGDVFVRANESFAMAVYREMVKAAPSAGSQEQGE